MLKTQLVEYARECCAHLYDLVYLRTHPLAQVICGNTDIPNSEKAWQLHRALLEAIDNLKPEPDTPPASHQWRLHQLLVLRYVEALSPQEVANRLAISRRHFYREYTTATEALANFFWERYLAGSDSTSADSTTDDAGHHEPTDRIELLRLETARVAQARRFSSIGDTMESVLPILQSLCTQRDVSITVTQPHSQPVVLVDQGILRQLLVGILGLLIEKCEGDAITFEVTVHDDFVATSAKAASFQSHHELGPNEDSARVQSLREIGQLSGAGIQPLYCQGRLSGFGAQFPTGQHTVLVVDDNADLLTLVERYLTAHGYDVITTPTSQEALQIAQISRPHVIMVDLMMPGQDGWTLLQTLRNQPETSEIPVVVCSVLQHRELVLSLGASAFIQKPITEDALIKLLDQLTQGAQQPD
jgi:CheY-like chemotaxis protein